jgi:hypothetical protein
MKIIKVYKLRLSNSNKVSNYGNTIVNKYKRAKSEVVLSLVFEKSSKKEEHDQHLLCDNMYNNRIIRGGK